VLTNNETALLVTPAGVNDLADAIVRLVNSEGIRARLGENARRVAVQEHTWTHNAQRVLEAYETLTDHV
jgi:glycosyltransferase involved in cell wall biosynthesis